LINVNQSQRNKISMTPKSIFTSALFLALSIAQVVSQAAEIPSKASTNQAPPARESQGTNSTETAKGGSFIFGTHLANIFDAPIVLASSGEGAGTVPGMVAQVYAAVNGKWTMVGKPRPFMGDKAEQAKHIRAESTVVPGTQGGEKVKLLVRVYNGTDFDSSDYKGQSEPFECTMGAGMVIPGYPVNLKPFKVVKVK
jgi:hypothetical protein